MIYPHSNETQTSWDRGKYKVQLNLPDNPRPIGFCDGDAADLAELAARAEAIAERWRDEQLGEPPAVSALLDEAFSARNAVVDARERAGIAGCALLAMSGVTAQDWPREEVDRE